LSSAFLNGTFFWRDLRAGFLPASGTVTAYAAQICPPHD